MDYEYHSVKNTVGGLKEFLSNYPDDMLVSVRTNDSSDFLWPLNLGTVYETDECGSLDFDEDDDDLVEHVVLVL